MATTTHHLTAFQEAQQYRQFWLWAVIIISLIAAGSTIFAVDLSAVPYAWLIRGVVIFTDLLVLWLFWAMRFETSIDAQGIHYRYLPFMRTLRTLAWSDLAEVTVREYSPLREFGGWGMRTTLRNGKAYSVAGKHGIFTVAKDGTKIMLGTQQPAQAQKNIERFFKRT